MPYKQTAAQIHAVPYKCTVCIRIGNVFSEMKANKLFDIMQMVDPTRRICKRMIKKDIIYWAFINTSLVNVLTFCGRISANMMNGNGRIPKQLVKMNVEKLTNGIQFNSSTWKPLLLKYEYVPNVVRPINAPAVEYVRSVLRPTRSTR